MKKNNLIAKMLRERGMTQTAFARMAGISSSHLSMVLHGTRRLGVDSALRIAKLLGVPMERLFQ